MSVSVISRFGFERVMMSGLVTSKTMNKAELFGERVRMKRAVKSDYSTKSSDDKLGKERRSSVAKFECSAHLTQL